MEISIGDNHKTAILLMQHTAQFFAAEAQRLQAETAYVLRQRNQAQGELIAFLQRAYGVDAAHVAVSVDLDRGMIIVPDESEAPENDVLPPGASEVS